MDYVYTLLAGLLGSAIGIAFLVVNHRWLSQAKAERKQADESRRAAEAWRSEAARAFKENTDLLARLTKEQADFDARRASLEELMNENRGLKRDLAVMETVLRKTELDREGQCSRQADLERKTAEVAERYLSDVEKWIGASINARNYAACKARLVKVIEWSRDIGVEVPSEREAGLLADLKADYEKAVRAQLEREEQARIKAQIREEQAREREVQRQLAAIERERAARQEALDRALAEARDPRSEEIERLRARVAEMEAEKERAVSQAQLTKAGYLYVISNIGAFGRDVYKVGMTRRLDPHDRVSELSDASVPFPFDVHMMISSPDAPALENALHKRLSSSRVNKVNPRKEFFRVNLEELRKIVVEEHGAEVEYTADPEALEYNQSLTMTAEDQAVVEETFENAERASGVEAVED